MAIIKQFTEWFGRKERLHNQQHKPPFVSDGDIWWVCFGENIGSEINGKSIYFSRPAVILKKLSHGRLTTKLGTIDDDDKKRVKEAFLNLYK